MNDDPAYEWVFTTAQTDALIMNVTATQRLSVSGVLATNAHNNTGDVACRLGFAPTALPTISNNSLTPAAGVFFSHGAIAPGGGAVGGIPCMGPIGVPLRLTCSAVSAGDFRICGTIRIMETE